MGNTKQQSTPVFHGCKRLNCSYEAPCFTPHPFSGTHETCLFSSALMRAKHAAYELTRSLTGETAYLDVTEIQLKASLVKHDS